MKRSLIVVLTMAMLLFAFAGVAAASEQEDAADRLFDFGVIEGFPDGSLGLDREITRAEFAKIAVVAKGLEDAADLLQSSASQFSDVATSVWYTGWVNVANAQEIVIGYPDGTFRPNDNITVAEAVSMILRTLGYNDNLPGAWPTNYLVKGSDLGITTGLVSNANVNAVRGDVFAMLNRALDEDVVAWETEVRGSDAADFRSKGYTLLQEMFDAKEETEGWVVGNYRTDEDLDANEIRIGDLGTEGTVFELMTDDDVDWLLGLEVEVKHNSDDEIAYLEVQTSDSNIIFDKISDVSSDKVELQVQDREYRLYDEDEVTVFVNFVNTFNGEDAVMDEVSKEQYGKFVLENGRVASAVLIDTEDIGVVVDIDDEIYEMYNAVAEDYDLDFDEFDEVVILDTQLKSFDGDIETYDVVYSFDEEFDGDDVLFVVVSNEKVTGELERLRSNNETFDRAIVDGDTYRVETTNAIATLDEGEEFEAWADAVEDLLGEDVILALDFIGYAMLAAGDSAATSGEQYGVLTWMDDGRNPVATIFTAEGIEVEYDFEDRNDVSKYVYGEAGFDQGQTYDFEEKVILVRYKINKDGEIAEGNFDLKVEPSELKKDSDRRSVEIDGKLHYIGSGTKFFEAWDGEDIDPSLVTYDSIYSSNVAVTDVVYFADEDTNEIKALVFADQDFVGLGDDDYYGVVTTRPWQDANDWYSEIDVFDEGENEYKIDDRDDFGNKSLVQFRITSSDKASVVSDLESSILTGTVADRDGNFLTVSGEVYRVASGAVLYEDGDDFDPIRINRIGEGDEISFLLNDDNEIVAAIVGRDAEDGEEEYDGEYDGTLRFEYSVGDETIRLTVDGRTVIYQVNENSLVLDKDENEIASGTIDANEKVIVDLIRGTDIVDVIQFVEWEE